MNSKFNFEIEFEDLADLAQDHKRTRNVLEFLLGEAEDEVLKDLHWFSAEPNLTDISYAEELRDMCEYELRARGLFKERKNQQAVNDFMAQLINHDIICEPIWTMEGNVDFVWIEEQVGEEWVDKPFHEWDIKGDKMTVTNPKTKEVIATINKDLVCGWPF